MSGLDRRAALGVGLAAAALPLMPRSAAAQSLPPAGQGAGWYGFRVGDFRCAVISDGGFVADQPMGGTFAINADPADVARAAAERFVDPGRFSLGFNALYVDTGQNKVLVDTGSSDKFVPTAGKIPAHLRAAGIDPAAIDTVVISHAHVDHLFGVLDPAGQPIFTNARYIVAETENAFWTSAADMGRSPLPPEVRQQFVEGARSYLGTIRPKTELVASGKELVPGVVGVATPGHTPGHQSFIVSSAGKSLFVTVDVVHNLATALSHPDWQVAFDADPVEAVAVRRRTLDRLATDRMATLFYHFPFPGLGHVARRGDAFAYEPIAWSWDPETAIG